MGCPTFVKINLGGNFMAKEKVSKVIPVAKRIIEFKSEDIRRDSIISHQLEDSISEEEWKKFAENALVIVDGWHINQYAEEYPIVRYKCDESKCVYLERGFRLNGFIESITVSTVLYGKKAWFGSGKLSYEETDYDTVVYYKDHAGINHMIIQNDLCWFLLQKPKLVVSPEGVLIFFTDKEIIATVACNNSYHWISGNVIDVKGKTIKDIKVCDDCCKVILLDDEDVEYVYKLNFDLDATEYQILCPKASLI